MIEPAWSGYISATVGGKTNATIVDILPDQAAGTMKDRPETNSKALDRGCFSKMTETYSPASAGYGSSGSPQ
jgi:hypothetical protein